MPFRLGPQGQGFGGLPAGHTGHGGCALAGAQGQLPVEDLVIETDGGRVLACGAAADALEARPEDGTQAHGAGFAGGDDLAAREVIASQVGCGGTNGLHLCVGRGIAGGEDPVLPAGDDHAILDHHGAEGASGAVLHGPPGQGDGLCHVCVHGC